MSWNGSGSFNRLYSWIADKAAGIDITASRMDADTNDITSNGFGNCLTRDGQGSASANQPMNGYKHTGVANAVAATDYVALGQLQAPGTARAAGIHSMAGLGDLKFTALPEALLDTGWYPMDGRTRPRTDPLWLLSGAVNAAYWAWGNGNGTTTYTLPDFRGRTAFGKDNMGGSTAGRLTPGASGVNGATLGAVGGDQLMQQHNHTVSITDPGHLHTYTEWQDRVAADGNAFGPNSTTANTGLQTTSNTSSVGTGISATTANTSSGQSQNIPPAGIANFIIYCGA